MATSGAPDIGEEDEKDTKLVCLKGDIKLGELSWQNQTGWGKSPNKLNFNQEGLVGHNWKQLDVITDFGSKISLYGVKCDYHHNPVVIMFSDDGKNFNKLAMLTIKFTENENEHTFDKPIQARYGRMLWTKTDGVNGIHAQFLGHKARVVTGKMKLGEFSFEMNTGWAKSVDKLNFNEEGLVGHYWKQLDVITDFSTSIPIIGIKSDYTKNPVILMFSDDGKCWNKIEMKTIEFTESSPEQLFEKPVNARFGRMFWVKTDGTKGLHAQFLSM